VTASDERADVESPRTILVVDDDTVFRARLTKALESRGFDVRGAGAVEAALALAREDSPELALVDLKMPGGSGLDVVRGLKAIDGTTNVVVLTGYGSIATALEAVRLGATHYLTKPADVDEILAAFERASKASSGDVEIEHEVASLARAEWEHIHRVLTDCNGNISQAARLLGLHRRSLQRKLSKYPSTR
jgi:two-component system response regulator RegA